MEKEQVPQTEKRETFKQPILRILKESKKPIKRPELVEMAIKQNPPKSKRPEWVYCDTIGKLRKDGLVKTSEERLKKDQQVNLK